MAFTTTNTDYQLTNVFGDVDTFSITVVIDAPLTPGVYVNPDIVSVSYAVSGALTPGTPSGFPSFALQRDMDGTEFYAQSSSLNFKISPTAVLSDGIQVAELVGNDVVLTYNARETGNGRFHPALFELRANGTGQIQNSDNVITENPLQQVSFGDEYINDLMFDPGNTTVITGVAPQSSGGGSISTLFLGLLLFFGLARSHVRKTSASRTLSSIS
jgi:hypothetical protein